MRLLSLAALAGLTLVVASGPFEVVAQPGSSGPAIRCVESVDGEFRLVDESESGVASCRGELFLAAEHRWGHSPSASRGAPEAEPGAVLRLRLLNRAEIPLPSFFIATGLRDAVETRAEEEVPEFDRILCETEGDADLTSSVAFRCVVPLSTRALRIEIDGFGTELLWNLELSQEVEQAAKVELEPGVLVTGRVPSEELIALLEPRGSRAGDEASRFAESVAVEEDGVFVFHDVAPGAYSVRLEASAGGVSRTEVVIPPGQRFELPALRSPVRLDVPIQIEPRLDGFDEPWRITWIATGTERGRAQGSPQRADETGWLVLEDLDSGAYLLLLEDSEGSLWSTQQVDLLDGSTQWIELDAVRLEGSATIGDEAFFGELVFGTTQGSQRVKVRTDRNGDFHGLLPKEGRWKIEISSMELGCGDCGGTPGTILIPPVDVEAGPSGVAHVEIEIPETRIEGRVVREEVLPSGQTVRKPQPEATVLLARLTGPSSARGRQAQVWTDEDGAFEIRGVQPGTIEVGASLRDPPSESRWQTVDLQEGLDAPPIELVLQEKVPTAIRVSGLGSPVGGALVTALLDQGLSARGVTGTDGSVTLDLPRGGTGTLVVEAAGFGLAIRRLRPTGEVSQGGAQSITLTAGKGTLEIARPREGVFESGWIISADAGTVGLRLLASLRPDSVRFGESVTISDLALGAYTFCVGDRDCRTFEIRADATTTIDLSVE